MTEDTLWNEKVYNHLREYLDKYKCHICGGDVRYFNSEVYNNPGIELIYECKNCKRVSYLMLGDCCSCSDKKAIPIEELLEIDKELTEDFLGKLSNSLEPQTHCCECTQGELHMIHIQYPECKCEKDKYILKKNEPDAGRVEP